MRPSLPEIARSSVNDDQTIWIGGEQTSHSEMSSVNVVRAGSQRIPGPWESVRSTLIVA